MTVSYTPYLASHLWPSSSKTNPDGGPALQHAEDFPPQHAASALAKLLRWAREEPTQLGQGLLDADTAETIVRTSYLGQTLSMRALSLHDANLLPGLYGDVAGIHVPDAASIDAMASAIHEALIKTNPMANPADLVGPVVAVYTTLTERFTVLQRP